MKKIGVSETLLEGKWIEVGRSVQPDATCARIDSLVETLLEKLGTDSTGWDTLYKDPSDGRLWELTYPSSDSEGGGPPRLACIDATVASAKYGIQVNESRSRGDE